jgi:hypothetical protein
MYDTAYHLMPSVAIIAGTDSGTAITAGGTDAATVTISSTDAITGVSTLGCSFSATGATRANGNVYNIQSPLPAVTAPTRPIP